MQHLIAAGHPFVICTDDKGLFGISLADEYQALDELFGLGPTNLVRLIQDSAQHAFCDNEFKVQLKRYITEESQKLAGDIGEEIKC